MTKKKTKPATKKAPAKKATKTPPKDVPTDDTLTVSVVAREVGIDPKAARAVLRAAGRTAKDGRWPTVERGSAEHVALKLILANDAE